MGRIPISLEINGSALKSAVEMRGAVQDAAEHLGVSRQTLSGWFTGNRIPPRRLADLARILDLSGEQVRQIGARKKIDLFFRTTRNVRVPEDIEASVADLARTFFVLDGLTPDPAKREPIGIHLSGSPSELATKIEKLLGITKYPRTLEQVVLSLRRLGVPVIFLRFEKSWMEAKIRAFTAQQDSRCIVCVDAMLPYEDALWHIIHEFCHLVVKETAHSKENEKRVTTVANEILTPSSYITAIRPEIQGLQTSHMPPLVRYLDGAAVFLGVSLEGLVLSLMNKGVIAKESPEARYLHATIQNKKKRPRLLLQELIFPASNAVEHWQQVLGEPSKAYLMRLGTLVREGVLQDRLSLDRAADLLSIDVVSMSKLARAWNTSNDNQAAD